MTLLTHRTSDRRHNSGRNEGRILLFGTLKWAAVLGGLVVSSILPIIGSSNIVPIIGRFKERWLLKLINYQQMLILMI